MKQELLMILGITKKNRHEATAGITFIHNESDLRREIPALPG